MAGRTKVKGPPGPDVHAFPVQGKPFMPHCNNLRVLLLLDFNHIDLLFAPLHGITDPRLLL
jgi:hypothetical protein